MDDATVVEYSLIVDVAMDGLHTRLDPDTFVVGERGHRGSIGGINDASSYIIMEKVSPQLLPIVSISSEAHDLGYQSQGYWRVGGVRPAICRSLLSLASFLGSVPAAIDMWGIDPPNFSLAASRPRCPPSVSDNDSVASRLRRADGTEDI
jgi:hypothetical protein